MIETGTIINSLKVFEPDLRVLDPKVIRLIVESIGELFKALGLDKIVNDITDLGDKALQAAEDGITPEKYETYEEYVKALNEYQTDKTRSAEISVVDKFLKGTELALCLLTEKFPVDWGPIIVYAAINASYFLPARFAVIGKIIAEDPTIIEMIGKYLMGEELADEDYFKAIDVLCSVEKQLDPEKSFDEIASYVRSLREKEA